MSNWKLTNSENVKAFVCDDTYSSKMLTGDEMAGRPVININEGTLKSGCRTAGGEHEETEIYYVVSCLDADVWLDDTCLRVKNGDIIVIPPHVHHWIDNTRSDQPFVLFTLWQKQEQNGVYFARNAAWGTSVALVDETYADQRIQCQ